MLMIMFTQPEFISYLNKGRGDVCWRRTSIANWSTKTIYTKGGLA